jgi:type I restriction enzyme S subunit
MATNQGFINIEPKEVDLMFLFYWLKNNRKFLNQMAIGSTFNELSKSVFKKIDILLPQDINEQKRIAEILSAFDDKIEVNNKIIKTLEQMAQEIFKEKFNSEKLKPEKWEIKNIEDVFVFEKGIEPGSKYYSETKEEGYIPFYRVRDLDKQSGVDVYIPEEIANGKICKENDVLLSLDATVGRVKIGCNGAFSSGIRKVYSKDGFIKNSFIYFWLKTPYVQNTILEHASGTTILHAGHSIKYLKFPFNKEVIEKIQSKVDPMFEKILQILKENQTLSALRDLLLPKLMSGEIRV